MTEVPLVVLAVTLVFFVGALMAVDPLRVSCGMAFLTAAFPKAGIKEGGFPFPIFLVLFVVAVLAVRFSAASNVDRSRPASVRPGQRVLVLVYLTFATIRILYVAGTAGIASAAPLAAWSIVPMVLYVSALNFAPVTGLRVRRAVNMGFVLAAIIGLAQQIFGVLTVQLEGLTYAYGDDLNAKHNIIFGADGVDTSKIPSTYQNGNIFGLAAVVFAVLALRRLCAREASRLDTVVFAAGLISVGFSGSRTALIALFVAASFVTFLQRGILGARIQMISAVLLTGAGVLAIRPDLAQRYSYSDLAASGGSGRSEIWAAELSRFSVPDYFIGVRPWRDFVDGWVGLVMQIGVIGAALLVALIVNERPSAAARGPLLALLIGIIFDSSYALFPTLFLPAVLLGIEQMFSLQGSTRTESIEHAAAELG